MIRCTFCLHTHARETDRILDAFLVVDRVFLRDHMQHTVLVANTHGFRRVDNVLNVFLRHLFFRKSGTHTDFISGS
ncbi:hypothetical protein HR12_29690 [Microbacterium sp. SUBG005]|nr:hypothetical protein HR12_29690 [Microbacterium sp. SUBG005]